MRHVSVEDRIAERSLNSSNISRAFGSRDTAYIRAPLSPSSSGVTLNLIHIPTKVMTSEKISNTIPEIRAEFFAVCSSFDMKFLDEIARWI